MAFVVEDGSGISGANSLTSVEFTDAYFDERGNTEWGTSTIPDPEAALVAASDYVLNRHRGRWLIEGADEAGPWTPGVVVPVRLQQAVAEVGLRIGRGDDLDPDYVGAQQVKQDRKSMGPISHDVTYVDATDADDVRTSIPVVDDLLRGLVRTHVFA